MKTKNLLFLSFIAIVLSSCYAVKLNSTPNDEIFESPLIQSSMMDKNATYHLSSLKHKQARFKYLRKIKKLNHEAKDRFRKGTLNSETYAGLCEISTVTLDIVTWIAVIENPSGANMEKSLAQSKLKALNAQKLKDPQLMSAMDANNLETEEGLVEFLKLIIAAMEKMLS